MSRPMLDGKCVAPKNPRPGVTTFFCVYEAGHGGPHSWEDTPETRREKFDAAAAVTTNPSESLSQVQHPLDRLAFWWLRKTHPRGVTVMATSGEQWMLANYQKLQGTERS